MKTTSLRLLLVITSIAAVSMACSLSLGKPKATPTAVIEPTVSVGVEQAVQTAVSPTAIATAGMVELKLTDAQMTQYINEQLKTQTDPVLENPQVHAHDGAIDVTGKVQRGVLSGEVKVSLVPSVDEQGSPHLKIDSANLGPFPVPDSLLNNFSDMIDESMKANADPQDTGLAIQSIQVFDGYIVITALPQ